ncbi:UNVERIFIED_CONTAM: hypothetical protein GTU68_064887 [Idotea baltica]|nr:hypothetical protein [Idotea baltica]
MCWPRPSSLRSSVGPRTACPTDPRPGSCAPRGAAPSIAGDLAIVRPSAVSRRMSSRNWSKRTKERRRTK